MLPSYLHRSLAPPLPFNQFDISRIAIRSRSLRPVTRKPDTVFDSDNVFSKLSQQHAGRTFEVESIKNARAKKTDHRYIAEISAWKDFAKISRRGSREFLNVAVDEWAFREIVMSQLERRLKDDPDSLVSMAKQLIDCTCFFGRVFQLLNSYRSCRCPRNTLQGTYLTSQY